MINAITDIGGQAETKSVVALAYVPPWSGV
jgi:hypothetical protein